MTTLLLLFHLALVQKAGISSPNQDSQQRQMPFYPNFVLREMIAWYGALAVLGSLAALFPWGLGTEADPFAPAPPGIKPEWFFLAVFYNLKLIPSKIWIFDGEVLAVLAVMAGVVGWMLVPFWDKVPDGEKPRAWVTGIGVLLVAYLLVFSALGYWT